MRAVMDDVGEGRQRLQQLVRHVVQLGHRRVLVDPAPVGLVEQDAVAQIVEHRLQHGVRLVGLLLAPLGLGDVDHVGDHAARLGAMRLGACPLVEADLVLGDAAVAVVQACGRGDERLLAAGRRDRPVGPVGGRADRVVEALAGRDRLGLMAEVGGIGVVAAQQPVVGVPDRDRDRQALQRIVHDVVRGACLGFGGGVEVGEILVGERQRHLLALAARMRGILHQERQQVEQRADADRNSQPVAEQETGERQQRQVEAGEDGVAARLVDAARAPAPRSRPAPPPPAAVARHRAG